jgi:XTP/dITP diphosphohydrolase
MRLIIASNNAHKVTEIKAILAPYFNSIQSLKDAGIDIDVVEDGKTFAENALKKAREVLAVSDADAALSDDSGLEVDALCGAPGVYSARYAGEGHDDAANNEKLLAEMKDVPMDKRTCRFVSAVSLVRRNCEPITVIGTVEGKLLFSPRGTGGFGYDPLFFYEPSGKSFAELSAQEKNEISHRARALAALREAMERESE